MGLAARLTGARFVYWMSYPFAESKLYQAQNRLVPHPHLVWIKGQLIRYLLYKIILPSTDHIFVQSQRMKEDVKAQGIPAEKMTTRAHGNLLRPSWHYKRRPDTESQKSDIALSWNYHAIASIRNTGARFTSCKNTVSWCTLDLVGEGQNSDDRHAVENEAVRLGLLSDVTITGFLPMSEAWKLVKQADICFSPFYPVPVLLSTSPTKLIEYMAMAKCIIANEHPEQQEVMSASGVGRCNPLDEQAFAEAVFYLLEDPERAKNMAAKGPDWVRVRSGSAG